MSNNAVRSEFKYLWDRDTHKRAELRAWAYHIDCVDLTEEES